jgi:hypothetical protein
MSELTPRSNEPRTDTRTGGKRDVSERFAELGRRSGEARRRKREAKAEQSNRDVAEAEIRAMLEATDPKVRREGVRLLSYLEGKKQPQQELEPEREREPGQGISLTQVVQLAREAGIEIATLDDVVQYAREHDLVLRPRRDGEGVGASSEPGPVPRRAPNEKGHPHLSVGPTRASQRRRSI